MLKIKIVAVGTVKEKYFLDAIEEYSKRLSRFCKLEFVTIEEESREQNLQKKIERESEKLLQAASSYKILMDIQGKALSSRQLSEKIESLATCGAGEISFIIGGSNGVSESLREACDFRLSFGKITFPHQLFKVVLLEQVYRAFTISANLPYHK